MIGPGLSVISVVVPVLNAQARLGATLAQFAEARAARLIGEIIVSDGGSRDDSLRIAEAAGALMVFGSPGRGGQLARGAAGATGDWLLFIHADTVLGEGWMPATENFIATQGENAVAAFTFALDDDTPAARRLERVVAWRCRAFSLPYGDQGLLISRRLYDALGGYRPLPLMEDVDLVRRIGKARLHILPVRAVTSAARYRRDGYMRRSLRNLSCLALYYAGLPPRLIAKLYG